jgi:hypothetical protein
VAVDRGRFVPNAGGDGFPLVSAEVYTFTDGLISTIQTFQPTG